MLGTCSTAPLTPDNSAPTDKWVVLTRKAAQNVQDNEFKQALLNIELAIKSATTFQYQLYINKAKILDRLGKRQQALDYLTLQIQKHPNQPEFIELRGDFLLYSGFLESARDDLHAVYLQSRYRSLRLIRKLIELEQRSNQPVKSKRFVNAALKIAPRDAALWFQKGNLEIKLFQFEAAERSIQKAIILDSTNFKYHQRYIEALSLLKKRTVMEQHLIAITQQFPHRVWGKLNLAALWIESDNLSSAKELLLKAVKEHPKEALIYYHLGTLSTGEKRWSEALGYYLKGLKIDGNSSWANIQVAKIYHQMGKTDSVVQHLTAALNIGTRELLVYETLAMIYNRQGRTFDAEKIIIEGLKLSPLNQTLLSEYGSLFEKRGNIKEAIRAYQALLKIGPVNFALLGKLGNLFRLLEDYPKAEAHLQQAKALSPKVTWIRAFLVETLSEEKKWEAALVEIEQMIAQHPRGYWPFARKGIILKKLKKYQEALTAINHALNYTKHDQGKVRWLFEAKGEILSGLGRYREAEKAMAEANDENSNNTVTLTKLAYIQVHLSREKALKTIKKVIRLEDVELNAIELYLYLTKQHSKIWKFKKGDLAERTYIGIIRGQFTQVEHDLHKLARQANPHTPYLTYLRDYLLMGGRSKLQLSNRSKRQPFHYWHYFYRGFYELYHGKHKKAKEYFNRALQKSPQNPWIMVEQALALEYLKEAKAAVVLLKKFIVQFPDSNWAKIRLALNYDLAKEYGLSESIYLGILKQRPDEHIALNNLAWLYLTTQDPKLKKIDQALKLSRKAVKIRATSANLDTLAEAFFQKKDFASALKAIERALDIDRKNLDYFKKQKKKILKAISLSKKKTQP
jgi:tetratricopeptide (TPR) repeat protein